MILFKSRHFKVGAVLGSVVILLLVQLACGQTPRVRGTPEGRSTSASTSFGQAGTPTASDSDGDGVPNEQDAYPNDSRRSQDIPTLGFAAIDISGTAPGNNNVTDVDLDDDMKAAFTYVQDNQAISKKWANGTLTSAAQFSLAPDTDVVAAAPQTPPEPRTYNRLPSVDRKSTRLNSSHVSQSRMPSSA